MTPKKTPQEKRPVKKQPTPEQDLPDTLPRAADILRQRWMHSQDVMNLLEISRTTLYKYRKRNVLVASKTFGRILFEIADVEAMLQKGKKNIQQ